MLPVHCYCCLLWLKLWLKQPFSWGLGFKNPARGFTGAIKADFLKTTINNLSLQIQFLQELIKIFVFWPNNY
jgi:hypothetical protein